MNVSAKDKATEKEQNIRIEASSGLSEDEIDKMVNDAQAHAAEDKSKRESIEVRNQADQQVYQTEKQLEEMDDKISDDARTQVQAAVDKVKEALKGENAEEIKSSTEALTQTWHQVASELYQQASAEQPPPGAETGPAPGADEQGASSSGEQKEGAVDADFEVVDEEPAEKK